MMKRMGIDPYGRDKLALLDRTRDQRVAVGERHRRVQLAHAAELALHNVEQLWATTPDLAGRKRGLFELWDDCAETGSDEIVAGGTAARGIVIGAIRARLRGPTHTPPQSSPRSTRIATRRQCSRRTNDAGTGCDRARPVVM